MGGQLSSPKLSLEVGMASSDIVTTLALFLTMQLPSVSQSVN